MSQPSTPEHASRLHHLPGGVIAVSSRRLWPRAALGAALWLGLTPLAGRALARLGRHAARWRLERWWAHGLRGALALRLEMTGLEHIDPRAAYVVVSLHEGFADVVALLHLPLPLRFVARDELFTWRLLGGYLRDTGQIEVSPERGAWSYRQLLRAARRTLSPAESLLIFPQASILGIEIDFSAGAFALARLLRRPILPVALTGGHRVWEHPYSPRLRFGQCVSLRVLPPIPAAEVQARDPEEMRLTIMRQLKAEALSDAMAPPRRFVPARDDYWDGYAYRIDPDFADLAADVARHRRLARATTGPPRADSTAEAASAGAPRQSQGCSSTPGDTRRNQP